MRNLPPLTALRAFEALGRRGSIASAAQELSVTHGAVSKQIKSLEAHLGASLTRREGARVAFTLEGARFFAQISKAFDALEGAARGLQDASFGGQVTISCMPGLVETWLIPHLPRFFAAHPDIDLTILPAASADGPDREADISILYGRPNWNGCRIRLLRRLNIFPVCAPALIDGPTPLRALEDLPLHTLIDDPEGTHWSEFFAARGVEPNTHRKTLRFLDFRHCLAAARAGLGVAMGDDLTAAGDLASGELVRPLRETMRRQSIAYYVVTPQDRAVSPALRIFVDWLTREIGAQEP